MLDEEVVQIIMKKFKICDTSDVVIFFKNMSKEELEKYLGAIKDIKGINKSQVARILRINRKFVSDVWDRA